MVRLLSLWFFCATFDNTIFPENTPATGLLKTLSIFAVGFFARPVGAVIFGYISDKHGRAASLKITPLLITLPTLFFCFLPSYQQIGIWAPFLLIILRIWQGICVGGEYANNIVYLCENTSKKHLYFIGSIGSCSGSLGILLASTVATICYLFFSHEALMIYGWRLAFSFSIILGITTFFMRRKINETSTFLNTYFRMRNQNPIIDSYQYQIKDYFLSFGITFLPATAFYFIFMFLPNALISTTNISNTKVLENSSSSLLARLMLIPLIGYLADQVGGIKIARTSCLLFLALSLPLFYSAIHFPNVSIYCLYAFAIITTLNAVSTPGLLMELLKPETRCTIFSLSFNICFGIFGGITPVICFFLLNKTNSKITPIFYLLFAAFVTLLAIFFFEKRKIQHENKLSTNSN